MTAAVELSDSTAIIILASIAGVYFSITAACSVVICRILYKNQCSTSPGLPSKFSGPTQSKNHYELNDLRGTVKGIRDNSDLVPGGRAGKWRQYVSSNQPLNSNITPLQQHNGTHGNAYNQERPKLPAIEEVGAGGEEEEEEVGREGLDVTEMSETAARDRAIRSQWLAKRKVRGRTSSTKLLLEEPDGGSSWTLTSTNGVNGLVGDVMSSLDITASLPSSTLAQYGQPPTTTRSGGDQETLVSIPRPVPCSFSSHIPGHTRSESPVVVLHSRDHTDTGTSLGADITSNLPARESPPITKQQQVRRTHKQLSLSTHSLPRQSTASTKRTLESQISAGGSGILPPADDSLSGSRPRLRRYASTASYTSSPSEDPVILVRPRSRTVSRRESYASNTLGRTSVEQEQYSSITSVDMERNYYTLQTRRGGGGREAGGGREGSPGWALPTKLTSSNEDVLGVEGREESPRWTPTKMSPSREESPRWTPTKLTSSIMAGEGREESPRWTQTKLTSSIMAGEGREESPRWTPTKLTSFIMAGEGREESPRWTPTKPTTSIVPRGGREGSPVWTLPRRMTGSKEDPVAGERDTPIYCTPITSRTHTPTAINIAGYEGQESIV